MYKIHILQSHKNHINNNHDVFNINVKIPDTFQFISRPNRHKNVKNLKQSLNYQKVKELLRM